LVSLSGRQKVIVTEGEIVCIFFQEVESKFSFSIFDKLLLAVHSVLIWVPCRFKVSCTVFVEGDI
jgi:hypothetical protein